MSDFCERRQHRARKPHVCELCNRPILPGCEYILVKGKVEGQFSSYKAHIHCDAIIEDYVNDSMYDGYFDTEEMVEQYIRKACSGCLERGEYDDECEVDPLFCEKAAQRALHPTVLAAAIESIRANNQEENT